MKTLSKVFTAPCSTLCLLDLTSLPVLIESEGKLTNRDTDNKKSPSPLYAKQNHNFFQLGFNKANNNL